MNITKQEVEAAQASWGAGIIRIGKAHSEGGDYVGAAQEHLNTLYGYHLGDVVFKPTLAAEAQFRNDVEGALSYFVGGNEKYAEDGGFAIKGWTAVRFENCGMWVPRRESGGMCSLSSLRLQSLLEKSLGMQSRILAQLT